MKEGDIHNRKGRIAQTLSRIKESKEISTYNKDIILEFKNFLESQDLSDDRISRYLYTWELFGEYIDWRIDHNDKSLLIDLVGDINKDNIKDRELSKYTKMEYKKAIRKMYSHFLDNTREDIDGEELTDFFTLTVKKSTPDPDKLPKPSTVKKLVNNARTLRDQAFIMTLWSSAGRIGEVLGLKWKDVDFGSDIVTVTFRDTKTGDDRKVPLHVGHVYLREHMENDPKSSEREEYIFRGSQKDEQLSHNGAYNIIKRAREQAGSIPEKIKTNPHAFRKGRATFLAADGMNQPTLCEFGGWVQGSDRLATYVGLAEADVEKGIRELVGIDRGDEGMDEEDLEPVQCHECGQWNKWNSEVCDACSEALTTGDMFREVQIEEKTDKFMEEIISSETEFEPDIINEKAKEFVKEEFNLEEG
jgi:integrase